MSLKEHNPEVIIFLAAEYFVFIFEKARRWE
jgi:hypothetical protein